MAFFASGAAILFFAAYPQIGEITANYRKLQKENSYLDKLTKKAVELEQVKTMPEFMQAEKVSEVLPSHKPLLEVLTQLNQAAQTNQVIISELKVSPGEIATDSTQIDNKSKSGKTYNILDLELVAVGQLENVEKFMSTIEKFSPITTITDLSLSRSIIARSGAVQTKAELKISSHFFTQSISTTIENPLPKIGQKEGETFLKIQEYTPPEIEKQTEIMGGEEGFFDVGKIEVDN